MIYDPQNDCYILANGDKVSALELHNPNPKTYEVDGQKFDNEDKPTNPKDLVGSNKLPLGLVPTVTRALCALGHLEGDIKYGRVNWREAGIRFSIYRDALERHIEKLAGGEWADPETHVPHIGNALACLSIIADAAYSGKLVDDRPKPTSGFVAKPDLPPVMSSAQIIDSCGEVVKHLRTLYKDKKPTDYYISGPKERE